MLHRRHNAARPEGRNQLTEFVNGTRSHRYHVALWLAANTGMWRGEILGLRWDDVDLDLGLLCVTRSLVSVGYELHETRGKSRSARRSINLDPTTTELLSEWRQRRCAEDPEFDLDDPEGHMFSRPDGTAIHPQLLPDAFKRLVDRPGSAADQIP